MCKYIEEVVDNKFLKETMGILSFPREITDNNTCLILVNAGTRSRIGPHRLYTELARRFSSIGYTTLRYDSVCTGDSLRKVQNYDLVDELFLEVEKGLFVDGLMDCVEMILERIPEKKIILGGLCGGAMTSVYTYIDLPKHIKSQIDGFFLLGIPIFNLQVLGKKAPLIPEVADSIAKGYLKKIFDLDSWRNLLKGGTDFRLALNSIYYSLLNKIMKRNDDYPPNINIKLVKAFEQIAQDKKRLFFGYGEHDILLKEYESGFEQFIANNVKSIKTLDERCLKKFVASDDSHNLFYDRSRERLVSTFDGWRKDPYTVI